MPVITRVPMVNTTLFLDVLGQYRGTLEVQYDPSSIVNSDAVQIDSGTTEHPIAGYLNRTI